MDELKVIMLFSYFDFTTFVEKTTQLFYEYILYEAEFSKTF